MDHPLEKYMLILSDSLFSNLALDNSTEMAVHSVAIFRNCNMLLILSFALAGYTIAAILNYILGRVVFNILKPEREEKKKKSESNINFIRNTRYLPLILMLTAVPFWGKFVSLFAGFCNVRFSLMLSICVATKLIYYCYVLYF